jgi:glyoxylase-like metal-dependent hydrolase (beta-lactamase superfamily II)
VEAPLVSGRIVVGDVEITALRDGEGRVEPTAFFAGASDLFALEEHRRWVDDDGRMTLPIGCYLVRSGDRTAVIDTGAGSFSAIGFSGGHLPDALAAAGVAPGDVDTVLLTHLHFDHVGGVTVKQADGSRAIAFPRAAYRCHPDDWTHFVDREEAVPAVLERCLKPVAGQLEPFASGEEVVPGVTALGAPGHTPGHCAFAIASRGERAVLLGDAAHCPLQLEVGELSTLGDVDPALAARTREALLREAETGRAAIGAAHFPGLQFGRIVTGGEARRWTVMP